MSEKEKKTASEMRNEFLNQIISDLENNTAPWRNGMKQTGIAINASTGKPYRGINMLSLTFYNPLNQIDNRWMTYKQAKDKGYQVKKGEKGSTVFFYREYDKNTKKDFDRKKIEHLSKDERKAYEEKYVYSFISKTSVFNGSQIDGIPPLEQSTSIDINEFQKKLIENSEAPIEFINTGRNFYSPVNDTISIANIDLWESSEELTSTIMHEIMHSTGHESRLGRDLKNTFGTPDYAREELVAEMGTVLALNENGFAADPSVFDNNKAYIKGWISMLKDKPALIVDIISDAEKAFIYTQENIIEKELTKEATMAEEIKKIADLDIGDFVTDGEEWAEVTQSSESGTYIDDKYYAYRGQLNDGTLEQFEVELNQLIAVSDFHEGNEVEDAKAEYGLVNDEKIKHQDGVEHKTDEKGNHFWYKNGELHREGDLPAIEREDGTREWYKEGKRHRSGDKPAIEWADGDKLWYINGKLHRDNDLPAIEWRNGDREWWKQGKKHRDNDKPAIEDKNGTKKWYINDKLHREGDLPAVEWPNGDKDWYKNGKRVAASHLFVSQEKQEYNNLTKEATMPKKETNVEQEKGATKKPAPFNIINAKNFAQSIKNGNSVLLTESNPELVYSLATGKPFSGPNQLLAQQQLADKGLKTNEIVTFKQANEMGAGVKAGSKHAVVLSSYDAEKNESSNYFYFTKEDTTIKSESKKLTFENVKPIECTSSEPEKYIADYLAASYLGVEFKAADGVKKEFKEKLSNQLDQAYEQKKFGKMYEIGHNANKIASAKVNALLPQKLDEKARDKNQEKNKGKDLGQSR